MKKNIAVIGCGYWGKNLIRNFSELDSLVAVCDSNHQLAQSYCEKYKVDNLSIDCIIKNKNIEGVVIAAPASLHSSMAIEMMNAGKHVFVEKPLAINLTDAHAMIKSAKKNDVQLMVGHLLQYHPIFVTLRKLVESNYFGTLKYIYSNRLSLGKIRTEEDVIWSFAPHDISMILSLIKNEPDEVSSEASCLLQPSIADIATIHMKFSSGLNAHVSVSWFHPYKEQKLVVIGEKATAVFDDTKNWEKKLAIYHHVLNISQKKPNIEKSDVEYITVPEAEPLRNECIHFLKSIENDESPITNGQEGLRVLSVLKRASFNKIQK